LPELLPEEKPALVHGDLWNGNVISNIEGLPCLIDPAAYYGHREVDLAMMKLFGGFDETFYLCYNDFYPLESGWSDRSDIYNLYPLLVHVNLFGGLYVSQVVSTLTKFS
jgi:fructosamine-3-kinase